MTERWSQIQRGEPNFRWGSTLSPIDLLRHRKNISTTCRASPGDSVDGKTMRQTNEPKQQMLRTAEAAEYCGSSASTFEKLRLKGGGPVYSKIGRRVVYRVEDLDAWLAANRRRSTSDEVTS